MSSSVTCHECQKTVHNRFCTNCGAESKGWQQASATEQDIKIIYDKTLYPYCICSCLFCCPTHVTISNKRVDTAHGWCLANLDTLDLRRITDIEFDRSCLAMCFNRGTITIHASDETSPVTKITCFGAKRIYMALREAWNHTKLTTVVQ